MLLPHNMQRRDERTSHWKSGVMVRSTLTTVRVMGCTLAASSSRGNWWISLCTILPSLCQSYTW